MCDTKKPLKKIQYFAKLFNNIRSKDNSKREEVEYGLLEKINELESDELEFFSKYYEKPSDKIRIEKFKQGTLTKKDRGSVTILRYNLLQYLLKNERLTSDIIELEKQKIKEMVDYDPFRSWKNDRILYLFCYYPYNGEILECLKKITEDIRKELNIIDKTKTKIVTFNGARNQGYDHCWIAIYDKKYESQQDAKQIFLNFWSKKITLCIWDENIWIKSNRAKMKIPISESAFTQFTHKHVSYADFNLGIAIDFFKKIDLEKELFWKK